MFVDRNKLNSFTKQLCLRAKENPQPVKMRNGLIAEVIYAANSDNPEEFEFRTEDYSRWWYLDGSSPTSSDFDLIETAIETFPELKKQGIKDRAAFLEIYPTFEEWLVNHEKVHGTFHGINSIPFTDGRSCIVYKFEQVYCIEFYNPANEEEKKHASLTLSYEAMKGFLTLYRVLETDEDTRRFWTAIGVPAHEIEAHLQLPE